MFHSRDVQVSGMSVYHAHFWPSTGSSYGSRGMIKLRSLCSVVTISWQEWCFTYWSFFGCREVSIAYRVESHAGELTQRSVLSHDGSE